MPLASTAARPIRSRSRPEHANAGACRTGAGGGVRALAGNPDAPVNAAWDAWFLKQLVTADLDPVTGLGDELLEERAGSGSHEIRTWLIAFAAAGRPLVWTSYEPVPEWLTGMGIGTTFEVA